MTSQLKPQNYRLKKDFQKVHRFLDSLTLTKCKFFAFCCNLMKIEAKVPLEKYRPENNDDNIRLTSSI